MSNMNRKWNAVNHYNECCILVIGPETFEVTCINVNYKRLYVVDGVVLFDDDNEEDDNENDDYEDDDNEDDDNEDDDNEDDDNEDDDGDGEKLHSLQQL